MPTVTTSLWHTTSTRDEDREACSIDMLEKGFSKDLITEACASPTPKSNTWKHCFITKDNDCFKMYDEVDGSILLTAKRVNHDFYISQYEDFPESFSANTPRNSRTRWFSESFETKTEDNNRSTPSSSSSSCSSSSSSPSLNNRRRFCGVLRLDPSRRGYRLYSNRCDHCDTEICKFDCGTQGPYGDAEGRQLLGIIKQRLARIEQADVNCRYTEITIPPIKRGGKSAVWCPRTIRNATRPETFGFNDDAVVEETKDAEDHISIDSFVSNALVLRTALPRWDQALGSLVMNFKEDRVLEPSSKNFVMVNKASVDVFQFGKASKGKYNLDFKFPFSRLQAFALALSACGFTQKS